MQNKFAIMAGVGVIALVVFGAGAAAMMKNSDTAQVQKEQVQWNSTRTQVQQPVCDDDNIVGKVAGGVIGGVAGSQIGSGNGKTAATIGGSVGGTLLGEEYIPTRNATCP